MAVIWSRTIESNHYEVRSAGASLRLYRNGVNHSQWNPNRPLSGCIWDLIVLPALFRSAGTIDTALVLGFGAGTVGRQLKVLVQAGRIVGLDLDPIHLSIADGFFDCAEGCELIAADAVEWIESGAMGASFDLIIDDIYSEEDGVPQRCAPMGLDWFHRLASALNPKGILIINLVEPERVKHLAPFVNEELKARFPFAMCLKMDGYENRIVAFSAEDFDSEALELHLKRIRQRFPRCSGVRKRYQIESISNFKGN